MNFIRSYISGNGEKTEDQEKVVVDPAEVADVDITDVEIEVLDLELEEVEIKTPFCGIWATDQVPEGLGKLMRLLGYGKLERKYMKNTRAVIKSSLEGHLLKIRLETPLYKQTKEYKLTNELLEYEDERKNKIMEVSRWVNDNTIEIKTIYPDLDITIIDTRTIIAHGQCQQKLVALSQSDHPLEIENLYIRKITEKKA